MSVALRTVLLTIVSLLIVLSRPLVAVARLLAAVVVVSAGPLLIVVVSGALVVGLLLTLIGLLTLMGLLLIGLRLRGAAPLLVLPRPSLLLLVRLLHVLVVVVPAATVAADPVTPAVTAPIVIRVCLLYTSPSPRDVEESRMPSSA